MFRFGRYRSGLRTLSDEKTIEPKNGIGMITICEIHTKK